MTNVELIAVRKRLRELIRNPASRPGSGGICSAVGCLTREFLDLMGGWPYHSGEQCYPIPGSKPVYAHHRIGGTLWKGRQLTYRLSLCRYLIEQIDKQLEDKS